MLNNERDHRLLFIPIETKVREFQAKLLLSCYAVEAGFEVIIGGQMELLRRIKYMPRGIYLEKGVASTKINSVKLLRNLGNRVVAWCEEGLVILDRKAYARDRVSSDVLREVDIFFAWGEVQAEAMRMKMPDGIGKIVLSGNPRFDLLRPPYRAVFSCRAEEIRTRYGPFFLINTNFGIYNNFYGSNFFISKMMQAHGRIIDRRHKEFLDRWVAHIAKSYRHFVSMVKRLSRDFPGYVIIIRPHPSENHQAWREETQGLPNVNVVHEGNVIPWILASEVLIHNSCTTGVESYVLEKPVVSYRPIVSEAFEPVLPRSVSICAYSEDELVETLKRVLEDAENSIKSVRFDAERQELLREYVVSTGGFFACEKIVNALVVLADKLKGREDLNSVSLIGKVRWILRDYSSILKGHVNRIIKGSSSDLVYGLQKFPGLTLEQVCNGVESFQKVANRFASVKVERIGGTKTCFRMYCGEE